MTKSPVTQELQLRPIPGGLLIIGRSASKEGGDGVRRNCAQTRITSHELERQLEGAERLEQMIPAMSVRNPHSRDRD